MPDFPPIAELLPHRGSAVLLRRVVAHDATSTTCEVEPAASVLWQNEDGSVPVAVALEYMSQAIAAHGGLTDLEAGRERRPGFFLGTRRLDLKVASFAPGEVLEVTARHLRGSAGMLAFDCAVRRPGQTESMVSGVLTVYLLESFEALTRDFGDAGQA